MSIRLLLRSMLVAAMLSVIGLSPAASRIWKPSPEKLTSEYASIEDQRPNGFVLIIWFVPSMLPPDSPGVQVLTALLEKYVFIIAVHAELDKATGSMSFQDIDALQASDQMANQLIFVPRDNLPPTSIAMVAVLENFYRQSFGQMGKGMKMFVFEAGAVNSCKKGELSVPFAGETYTWETPFPGCPEN